MIIFVLMCCDFVRKYIQSAPNKISIIYINTECSKKYSIHFNDDVNITLQHCLIYNLSFIIFKNNEKQFPISFQFLYNIY